MAPHPATTADLFAKERWILDLGTRLTGAMDKTDAFRTIIAMSFVYLIQEVFLISKKKPSNVTVIRSLCYSGYFVF